MADAEALVMAETHDGNIIVLQECASVDEAEDWPIRLADYRRVWVERYRRPSQRRDLSLPLRVSVVSKASVRLADTSGEDVMIIMGSKDARDQLLALILKNFGDQADANGGTVDRYPAVSEPDGDRQRRRKAGRVPGGGLPRGGRGAAGRPREPSVPPA